MLTPEHKQRIEEEARNYPSDSCLNPSEMLLTFKMDELVILPLFFVIKARKN